MRELGRNGSNNIVIGNDREFNGNAFKMGELNRSNVVISSKQIDE